MRRNFLKKFLLKLLFKNFLYVSKKLIESFQAFDQFLLHRKLQKFDFAVILSKGFHNQDN